MTYYIAYLYKRVIDIAFAPILFHFGHISWVCDLYGVFGNASATQILFFIALFILGLSFCSKNSALASHRRRLFKRLASYFNYNILLAPFAFFFSSIKSSFAAVRSFIKKLKL